ncbi:MAG: hypothetical protein JWM95_891 [Gemmatimonadetes bacterium]|nr:hypothetical protein [Gemmatimonadota bacterium]
MRALLQHPALRWLRRLRRTYLDRAYRRQRLVPVVHGAFSIAAPKDHILVRILATQPQRDLCIGIAAKFLSQKYPDASMIDVGANIGDTAAVIATYAANPLILVEGSDYFFEILKVNARQFRNPIRLEHAMIATGEVISGGLRHWGGTAEFDEDPNASTKFTSRRLADIADGRTCFVKSDTDGYDFKILLSSVDWLARARPGVLFESQIRTDADLAEADHLCDALEAAGYTHWIVWDDTGLYMLATTSIVTIKELNRYLLTIWRGNGRRSIWNFDILCLHGQDGDVFEQVRTWFEQA